VRTSFVILALVGWIVAGADSMICAQGSAQQLAPWQQSWSKYGAELGSQMSKGVGPDSELGKKIFYNKPVTWEGTLKNSFEGKQGESVFLTMEQIEFSVPVSFFPGGEGSALSLVKIGQLLVHPSKLAIDAWKKIPAGTKIRFRANTGTSPVTIGTLSRDGRAGGLVVLAVYEGEPLTP